MGYGFCSATSAAAFMSNWPMKECDTLRPLPLIAGNKAGIDGPTNEIAIAL